MSYNAYDIKEFYKTKTGRFARRELLKLIRKIWRKPLSGNVLTAGFTTPYLPHLQAEGMTEFVVMPSELGPFWWQPKNAKGNRVGLCHQSELPFPEESVESILSLHALEFARDPEEAIAECWRVLKPQGRLLIIVSNRSGLWARRDHTPFGQGQPYSMTQVVKLLKENNFVIEQLRNGLYTPPFRSELMLKAFSWLEYLGAGSIIPFFAGVHVIEASKQLYAVNKKLQPKEAALLRRKIRFSVSPPTPQPS